MEITVEELIANTGVDIHSLELTKAPSSEVLNSLDPIYISYFIPWNSITNYELAKSKGFKDLTHEWDRRHHIENFDQIDSPAYLVHSWMKYPKFGHASATDYAARYIRYGVLTREEAIELVNKHDHDLDPLSVDHFCSFVGYSRSQFWNIIDKFYNTELFKKNENGKWVLKKSFKEVI